MTDQASVASGECWRAVWRGERQRLASLAEQFQDQALAVVFMEDGGGPHWLLEAYFATAPDAAWLAGLAGVGPDGDSGGAVSAPVVEHLAARDWVAESNRRISPVQAGRFIVHGAATAVAVPVDGIEVIVEASLAFGTGEHASTRGCLLALDDLAGGAAPAAVLDMGCGSAILAIAAARLWPAPVLAVDNDPAALIVARQHLVANGVAERVRLAQASTYDDPVITGSAPFYLVVANILAGPLQTLARGLPAILGARGRIVLSGFTGDQAAAVLAAHRSLGMDLESRRDVDGWTSLVLRRA
ncbi:MAG: 50S ribosomal protein L11 methyltransferase [Alphaproteobacteria bacterium]